MEANDFLYEGLVVVLKSFPVLLQVQNGSTLRLHLIDVQVVDTGNFVASFGSFYVLLFLDISLLGLLFGHSYLILDAEVVVALVSCVELFEIFTLELTKLETLLLNLHRL